MRDYPPSPRCRPNPCHGQEVSRLAAGAVEPACGLTLRTFVSCGTRSSPVVARLGTIPMSGSATSKRAAYGQVLFRMQRFGSPPSRTHSVAKTGRRGQARPAPLQDAAHGYQHVLGAAERQPSGRCRSCVRHERDEGQKHLAHVVQPATDSAHRARRTDRAVGRGRVHAVDCRCDAACLLDGEHGPYSTC